MLMTGKKRRTSPIRVREPEVAPLSEEDYQQAAAALAVMIGDWWTSQQCDGGAGSGDEDIADPC
jgi:hypothetical protein